MVRKTRFIQDINNTLLFSITINIFLATAIKFFIDADNWIMNLVGTITKYYGLSIIFLIGFYVFYNLNQSKLTNRDKTWLNKLIILNIFISGLLMFITIYPSFFKFSALVIVPALVICLTFTIIIPAVLFATLFFKTLFPKLPINNKI